MTAPAIVLSKTAPWATADEVRSNNRLRNCYRERFAFVDGRRFRAESGSLDGGWFVTEVAEDGEDLWVLPGGRVCSDPSVLAPFLSVGVADLKFLRSCGRLRGSNSVVEAIAEAVSAPSLG